MCKEWTWAGVQSASWTLSLAVIRIEEGHTKMGQAYLEAYLKTLTVIEFITHLEDVTEMSGGKSGILFRL